MNFQQFQKEFGQLKQRYPLPPSYIFHSENSEYGNYLAHCQNSFFAFDTSYSQNLVYIYDSFQAKDCVDGDYVVESEKCYECVDTFKAYNSTFLNYCARIYDSHFCYDCNDSNDLFGCVYLNFKKYCIFNRQFSEEEYKARVKELLQLPWRQNLENMEKLFSRFPLTSTVVSNAENSDYGNHVHYSKNMYLCFDAARSEDCAYLFDSHRCKNCFDLTQSFSSEKAYECYGSNKISNSVFINNSDRVVDSGWCENCRQSHHLFGCVDLINQDYCFLNRKLGKDDYEREVSEVMTSYYKDYGR